MEVFSAQEKSPLAHWNVSGIKKVKDICADIVLIYFPFATLVLEQ